MLYIFIQKWYANKKVFNKKANKLCLMGQIVIESHSFLEWTEPLNPRAQGPELQKQVSPGTSTTKAG